LVRGEEAGGSKAPQWIKRVKTPSPPEKPEEERGTIRRKNHADSEAAEQLEKAKNPNEGKCEFTKGTLGGNRQKTGLKEDR